MGICKIEVKKKGGGGVKMGKNGVKAEEKARKISEHPKNRGTIAI